MSDIRKNILRINVIPDGYYFCTWKIFAIFPVITCVPLATSGGSLQHDFICCYIRFGLYMWHIQQAKLWAVYNQQTTNCTPAGSGFADYKQLKLCQFWIMIRSIFIIMCVVLFPCLVIRGLATHWIMSSLVESNFYEYRCNKGTGNSRKCISAEVTTGNSRK